MVIVQDVWALLLRTLSPSGLIVVQNVGALSFRTFAPASLIVVKDIRALGLRALGTLGALGLDGRRNGNAEEGNDDGETELHVEIE